MSNLKVCPFCGSRAELDSNENDGWILGCANRRCDVSPHIRSTERDKIIATWNTRAVQFMSDDLLREIYDRGYLNVNEKLRQRVLACLFPKAQSDASGES